MTQPTAAPYKQLLRPTDDRIVAGVCSGIGRYLNTDPTLVRVAYAILVILTWGAALLAYPAVWFLIPEAPTQPAPTQPTPTQPAHGQPAPGQPATGQPAPGQGPWRDPADPTWGQLSPT
jgi:phage shock protein C